MVAGLQREEFSDPLSAHDDEDELELSLGLSIGGGKKRKAEIDFLSGSFPVVGSVVRTPNPIPAMPLYMPPPCRSLPPPSSNLNLNENPNPNHRENGGKRSVRMKRTPSYSGSPMSSSSGPIRGRSSSSSETQSHSDPYAADQKPNKQAIQEVVSKPTTQAPPPPAAAEKVDHMPCVMTMGRNGNTVNGVLYRYNEREVSIVCVCHGTPFSPEGFVRHAGGMESSNPLRQIVVVPS